jgi:hypothetical protein
MQDEIVKFRDLPSYDQNPFIQPIVEIRTKKKIVRMGVNRQATLSEDGEYLGDSFMVVAKKVDKEEFVKVFKDQISLIFDLTKTAQKILVYIIKSLGINKDYVVFDKEKAKEVSGLASTASIYAGLTELIKKGVLAKSHLALMYYINPAIIFNGDRLTIVNQWIKEGSLGPSSNGNIDSWPAENKELSE